MWHVLGPVGTIKFVHFDGTLRGISKIRKHFRGKGLRSLFPVRVLVSCWVNSKNSVFSSSHNFRSPHCNCLASWEPLNARRLVTKYHRVFCTVSALSVPSCPVSHRRSSCSALSGSARFWRLPFPDCFNSRRLISSTFLLVWNTELFTILYS